VFEVAGIIAVLSPGLDWKTNVAAADRALMRAPTGPGYPRNWEKAARIVSGQRPEEVLIGPKVTAFYRLVRDGGNPIDVCVDGHAANMALGRGKRLLKDSDVSATEIAAAQAGFRRAAQELGVWPCAIQAATWLGWRASGGFLQGRLF